LLDHFSGLLAEREEFEPPPADELTLSVYSFQI